MSELPGNEARADVFALVRSWRETRGGAWGNAARVAAVAGLLGLTSLGQLDAQKPPPHDSARHAQHAAPSSDSAFRALQERGRLAMGVDQYTSVHRFDDLPDGGRVELQSAADDTVGARTIRAHMRDIQAAFRSGDFSTPGFVHLRTVPGTAVMAARRARIRYEVEDLPRGAALRLRTSDAAAIVAIHDFLAFQRGDHRAGGAELPRKPLAVAQRAGVSRRTCFVSARTRARL